MGAVPRLIAHHPDGLTLAVELIVLALVVVLFAGIWVRERRRRADRTRQMAEMRDERLARADEPAVQQPGESGEDGAAAFAEARDRAACRRDRDARDDQRVPDRSPP